MTNEAALKSMAKMIQVMLPYEMQYTPKQKSTKALREIVDVLRETNPRVDEFLGFVNFIFKKMDESEDDNGAADRMLMNIWAIINNYYPPVEDYPDYTQGMRNEDEGEDDQNLEFGK